MKKKSMQMIAGACASLFLLLPMAGCAKGGDTGKAPEPATVTAAVRDKCAFPEMIELSDKTLTTIYGLDPALLEGFSVLVSSSGATADEVAVFKVGKTAVSGVQDNMTAVKEKVTARKDDQKESFTGYVPEEIPKIEKAVIETKGDYCILVIAKDTAAAQQVISEMF